MFLLQQKVPLELFVKSREFIPGSGFLSRRDMTYAVERDVKSNSFLPSFQSEPVNICHNQLPLLYIFS